MVYLQFEAKRFYDILTVIQTEIDKNPNGNIKITFESVNDNFFENIYCWSDEITPPTLRSEKDRIEERKKSKIDNIKK